MFSNPGKKSPASSSSACPQPWAERAEVGKDEAVFHCGRGFPRTLRRRLTHAVTGRQEGSQCQEEPAAGTAQDLGQEAAVFHQWPFRPPRPSPFPPSEDPSGSGIHPRPLFVLRTGKLRATFHVESWKWDQPLKLTCLCPSFPSVLSFLFRAVYLPLILSLPSVFGKKV